MEYILEKKKEIDETILSIAKCEFNIETLEVRGGDDLDFHDVYVASIKDALEKAFAAGMNFSLTK